MITFLYPWCFLLLLLPWLGRWLLPAAQEQHGEALRVPFTGALAEIKSRSRRVRLPGRTPRQGRMFNALILWLIWILLVTALVRPQWLGEPQRRQEAGYDILMVTDISISMAERDFKFQSRYVSRMDAAKATASAFLQQRPNDRVGLIVFGTLPYLQAPITYDKRAVEEVLWSMRPGMAGNSTSIGDAVGLALKTFDNAATKGSKIIILLTDGENNDGALSMPQALSLAQDADVKIYTIGVGQKTRSWFGKAGLAGVDEKSLRQLAEATEAQYFQATDGQSLSRVYTEINRLEPSEGDASKIRTGKDLFYWPLGLAAALLILLWQMRRGKEAQ